MGVGMKWAVNAAEFGNKLCGTAFITPYTTTYIGTYIYNVSVIITKMYVMRLTKINLVCCWYINGI